MTRGALYMQAIRGPLVLITLGALFAMHQSGQISFARTWPLIIIVIGFLKLIERLLVPPGSYPAGNYPPSNFPPGSYPAGTYPAGTYPAGSYQNPQQPAPPPPGAPRV